MAAPKTAFKKDPFSTQKTKASKSGKEKDSIDPKDSIIKSAVDDFVAASKKEAEGKADKVPPKDTVEGSFACRTFAKRFVAGKEDSFYIQGNNDRCLYMHQDLSTISTEEELAELSEKWGESAADTLFEKDYGSIKLNGKFLKDNWDSIVPRLMDVLGDDFGELFSEAKYKNVPNVLRKAKDIVDGDAYKFEELMRDLKIRAFIKK